ncbi:hypothetical protein [Streptomyces termitum]|uniref:hypothetical protein n=1 Tax=Streptomyces termitum TaxID=67368 RepID=UPI00378B9261
MADERYQWLDPEAAERLLRGDPIDPAAPAEPTAPGAAALAEALDAVRLPAAATTAPLAGEDAAVAAFRAATAARASVTAPAAAPAADLGRVRLAPVPGTRRRWGRSLRYGFAAAVAAVTVGGVAVAAGTGVIPLIGEEPSRTVTAVEPPSPDGARPTGETRRDPSGAPTPGVTPTARQDGAATAPADPDHPGTGASAQAGAEGRIRDCREFRSGHLDAAGRTRLSRALRADESLRSYCDRLLTGDTNGDGDENENGNGDEDTGNGTDGDENGGNNGNSGNNGKGSNGNNGNGNGGKGTDHGTAPATGAPDRKQGRSPGKDKGGGGGEGGEDAQQGARKGGQAQGSAGRRTTPEQRGDSAGHRRDDPAGAPGGTGLDARTTLAAPAGATPPCPAEDPAGTPFAPLSDTFPDTLAAALQGTPVASA